ncbi:MAG: folate family ECF transporter S component [Clostridia bacterium]|nr:folate family ECF transporter S component [Clostridia bacterium]
MQKNKKYLFCLILTAILTAVTVVLSRFLSFNIWNMSIGFSFVGVMLCGMLLGSVWGGACGALADFIGAILFPFGPYFPGFTATAFLSGAVFGLVGKASKNKKSFIPFALLLLAAKELVCSLILNSWFIDILYGGGFLPIAVSRLPLSVATLILEFVFAVVLGKSVLPKIRKEV